MPDPTNSISIPLDPRIQQGMALERQRKALKLLCSNTHQTLENLTVDAHFHALQVQALDRAVQDWLRFYYAQHPDREPGAKGWHMDSPVRHTEEMARELGIPGGQS